MPMFAYAPGLLVGGPLEFTELQVCKQTTTRLNNVSFSFISAKSHEHLKGWTFGNSDQRDIDIGAATGLNIFNSRGEMMKILTSDKELYLQRIGQCILVDFVLFRSRDHPLCRYI